MPRPGHAASAWALAGVLFLGLLATWALAIARYGGPDEPGHVLRAAAAAHGDVRGLPVHGLVAGFRSVEVPAALATGDPKCFRHDQRRPATCATSAVGVSGQRRAASSAGMNPPWYYLAVGSPVRALGGESKVIGYRLAAAAWCAAVLALAFVRARPRQRLWLLIAIAPASWFLAGVVNPNALEIALAALAWVSLARCVSAARPRLADLAWISVPTALAILIRPVAAVTGVTVLVVFAVLRRARPRLGSAGWAVLGAPPAAAALASLAWMAWAGVEVSDPRAATAEGLWHRFSDALGGVGATMRELTGSLGWAEFSAPWILQVAWWSAVIVAGACAWRAGGARRWAWLVIAGSVVVVPVAFETVLAGRLGFIWQGRYSISTAIGLVLAAPIRHATRRWSALVAAGAVVAEVGALWATLRRYAVGTNGSWLLRDERWHTAVPPFVLLGANVLLMIALVLWAHGASGATGAADAGSSAEPVRDLLAYDVER